jgi:hypothetical protein
MLIRDLNTLINPKNDLLILAEAHSKDLVLGENISAFHFLCALMQVESSFGTNNVPRFEHGYSRMGLAFRRSTLLREGYAKWGDLCAMSFGPTQILWIVAHELGFQGHPCELWDAHISLHYTCLLLRKNKAAGADTLRKLAATYNAGLGAIKGKDHWPSQYVSKFEAAYDLMVRRYPAAITIEGEPNNV